MTDRQLPLPEHQLGPAEKLLDLLLNASAHLWHNRPGYDVDGRWVPAKGTAVPAAATRVNPGLHEAAAVALYLRLLELYQLNVDLTAHFASYALTETDWRDLKVACAALMLVQGRKGEPVLEDDGTVAFYDDDYRTIGEAMVLRYERKSKRMMTPKAVLRLAELLEVPAIAEANRKAGFGDPAAKRAPLGRWTRVARRWLQHRERNRPLLEGLVAAGYKDTLKTLARKVGYKPDSEAFFEILGWKQKQAEAGHRTLGLEGLKLKKRQRFDGLSEVEICEKIETQSLSWKDAVGRLPSDVGLTPAIAVVLLPSLSDRDLCQLTPTLEELGLMADPEIRRRWEIAVAESTDQRALNIAKNLRSPELREKLEEAADHAVRKAVEQGTRDVDVRVMFLIDKSGSMTGAIEQSKEALSRILSGFPLEKLHVATFDTAGTILKPKAATRTAVQHMLSSVNADGGTIHGAAVRVLRNSGVTFPKEARLVVIVVGDEAGEAGTELAKAFREAGYAVSALALMVNVATGWGRGTTLRDCARELHVPYSEVTVDQFNDPYQVTRVLAALMEAPLLPGATPQWGLVEKVMATPLLTL